MKHWVHIAMVSVTALLLTAAGTVANADQKAAGKDKDAPAASPRAEAAGMKGEHTMTGEVTKVDKDKGLVTVKTKEATLDLHFPPPALKDVKQGDRVTVELGLKEAGAAASPGMPEKKTEKK